jgi:GDP-D-mannose dehydratase
MPNTALTTGITEPDGWYLAEFLVYRSYYVYGQMNGATAEPEVKTIRLTRRSQQMMSEHPECLPSFMKDQLEQELPPIASLSVSFLRSGS